MDATQKDIFSWELSERRERILACLRDFEATANAISEREIEFEEEAERALTLERQAELAERRRVELAAVERALQRIESGSYGICEDCGEPIGMRRLMALPWASLCPDCASQHTPAWAPSRRARVPARDRRSRVIATQQAFEARIEELKAELEASESIDASDLETIVEQALVILSGSVPTDDQRRRVLQLFEEALGPDRVVDDIVVTQREPEAPKSVLEVWFQGEDINTDAYESIVNGTPFEPDWQPTYRHP